MPMSEKPGVDSALDEWMKAMGGGSAWHSREPVAHRLAKWLDWTDAIALASALEARGAGAGAGATPFAAAASLGAPAKPALSRKASAGAGLEPIRSRALAGMRTIVKEALTDWARDPAGSRDAGVLRRAVAQAQRQMEASVARGRATLRGQLQAGTAEQRELAALDSVLEQALAERQRHLLAGAPGRLAHPAYLGDNAELAAVERRLTQALAAELELRLQPLQGLVQALQPTANPNS